MKTDVDTCIREIAGWYVMNRREIAEPELEAILRKHCETEKEVRKFIIFLGTESGQARFKALLRERKQASQFEKETGAEEWKIRESIADTVYGLQHGVSEEDIRKGLTRNPRGKYWYEPEEVDYIISEAKKKIGSGQGGFWLGIAGAEKKFPLGQIVMTRGVSDLAAENAEFARFASESLRRHASGDWGDLPEEDKKENEFALSRYLRILSAYEKPPLPKIWIITEADRSATTILFPEEY